MGKITALAITLVTTFTAVLCFTVKLTTGDQVFIGTVYLVIVIVLLASIGPKEPGE